MQPVRAPETGLTHCETEKITTDDKYIAFSKGSHTASTSPEVLRVFFFITLLYVKCSDADSRSYLHV